jgi:phenylacetate-CoA ligase
MLDRRAPLEALGWRMLRWWGLSPAADGAYVWRLVRAGRADRWLNAAAWWPTRRVRLDASRMTADAMRWFIERCRRLRPPLLQGYVGAVDHLAAFVEVEGLEAWRPRAVWVTSSPMAEVQRRRIERAFGAPVYDQYGCGEVPWLAAQCGQQGGLHVFEDARHIEFVDDSGAAVACGTMGRIVITCLENYMFPLIRYANDDVGRALPGRCPCGVNLPMMDQVRGRESDGLSLPGGAYVGGDYLTTLFDAFPEVVRAFQVRQARDYSVRLLYVPSADDGALKPALGQVRASLRQRIGPEVPLSLEPVAKIPHDRGKLQFVISEVAGGGGRQT